MFVETTLNVTTGNSVLDALPPIGLIGFDLLSLLTDVNTCETVCESLKKQLVKCP